MCKCWDFQHTITHPSVDHPSVCWHNLTLDWVWNDCMVCIDVRILWMEVTEINTDQLKQKEEIYDKEAGGFWNENEKQKNHRPYFLISNF